MRDQWVPRLGRGSTEALGEPGDLRLTSDDSSEPVADAHLGAVGRQPNSDLGPQAATLARPPVIGPTAGTTARDLAERLLWIASARARKPSVLIESLRVVLP
ncbi:hypothetical protein [Streptomyces sp. sk226]|uniref:hypothetical protein n=1 Tax=Streptomyces sp. sk226 TaxID=2034268 RepID=UPI000BF1F9AB|nr:hypothetical protein [Streptomyces sp. sk226]